MIGPQIRVTSLTTDLLPSSSSRHSFSWLLRRELHVLLPFGFSFTHLSLIKWTPRHSGKWMPAGAAGKEMCGEWSNSERANHRWTFCPTKDFGDGIPLMNPLLHISNLTIFTHNHFLFSLNIFRYTGNCNGRRFRYI